jgi:peptidoglycan/LPS O-acetylase OafA/YrhL
MALEPSGAVPAMPRTLPSYFPALDGVRGIAILWVVMHNLSVAEETLLPSLGGRLLVAGLDGGWAAVTLFFALSGFLITGILLDGQKDPSYYRNFYVRRALRIFPLYYAVLFVAFFVLPLWGTLPPRLAVDESHQLWLWLYLSNWAEPYGMGGDAFPHFWSLAVEEQFYLLWPFLIRHRTPRAVVKLCLALAAAALVIRIGMFLAGARHSARRPLRCAFRPGASGSACMRAAWWPWPRCCSSAAASCSAGCRP